MIKLVSSIFHSFSHDRDSQILSDLLEVPLQILLFVYIHNFHVCEADSLIREY